MRKLERQFVQRCAYMGVDIALSMRLFDHLETASTRDKCIKTVESWLIRRMLTGCNAGGYDGLFKELVRVPLEDPYELTSRLRRFGTWPTDPCIRRHVESTPISKRKSRKTRMVLEGIESFLNAESDEAGSQVVLGSLEIEHVMPRKWRKEDWPPCGKGTPGEEERDRVIWTLGNLTLLTCELNSKLSNHSWKDKQNALRQEYDNLCLLTRRLLEFYGELVWNEDSIRRRSRELAGYICRIWPSATDD